MQAISGQGTMAAIAAAVTPVVMISANAILIGTISTRHESMADRIRSLTAEWRHQETTAVRRDAIQAQIRLFSRRIAWISRAHFLLYIATICFIAMVMVIALTPLVQTWAPLSVPLLLVGVTLMLTGILLELLDLKQARITLEIETGDVRYQK